MSGLDSLRAAVAQQERERAELRAAGAAEERARIVAMLRDEAAKWTERWEQTGSPQGNEVGDTIEDLADRIERGET